MRSDKEAGLQCAVWASTHAVDPAASGTRPVQARAVPDSLPMPVNQQEAERNLDGKALLTSPRTHMQALSRDSHRYDGLVALIGDTRFALLDEVSHGTQEFYRDRTEITKRLIIDNRFTAVAVEADWPDTERQSH